MAIEKTIASDFKHLCTPALIYLVISIVAWIFILIQNLGHTHSYNVGSFSCKVPHTGAIMIIKLIYILFWTWILHLICRTGHKGIAYFLVFLPFILFFI